MPMSAIASQYHAALAMLRQAIEGCSDALWLDAAYKNSAWNIAYHTLFYTQLYLSASEDSFRAPALHQQNYNEFGAWPEPYTRHQMLALLDELDAQVERRVAELPLEQPSGFPWLPFSRLELHLYNIRHIMLHTGELAERLGAHGAFEVGWVSCAPA